MTDSILDKVIDRRDAVEKQDFDAVEVVRQLMSLISDKESQVLVQRFGLLGNKKQTLEVIGKTFDVTRERIRQIERQAIANIQKNTSFRTIIRPVEHVVTTTLAEHGGIMTIDLAAEQLLSHRQSDEDHRSALFFLLSQLLGEKIELIRTHDVLDVSWRLRTAAHGLIEEGVQQLTRIIETMGEPATFEDLHQEFQKTEVFQKNTEHFTESVVRSYLHASAKVGKNPFDEFGFAHWGHISPKRMHDRVYLVLKKQGEPMHFAEIAEQITALFGKKAYPPTVHNELILNEEYVLVGRGLYALKEWGYQEGIVSDIITTVLEEAGESLSRDEIVNRVLEQRVVKRNTIHLALTDKSRFTKMTDGRYTLATQAA